MLTEQTLTSKMQRLLIKAKSEYKQSGSKGRNLVPFLEGGRERTLGTRFIRSEDIPVFIA